MTRLGFAVVLAGIATPAVAGQPPIRIHGERAVVVDDAGAPVMTVKQGDPAFARIGNPRAVIFDADSGLERVRVSGFGQDALWISCEYLADAGGYCEAAIERKQREAAIAEQEGEARARTGGTRGFSYRRAAEEAAAAEAEQRAPGSAPSFSGPEERGVPVCPGDPRCP